MIVFEVISIIIFSYLAVCTLYNLIFALASVVRAPKRYTSSEEKHKFAILIPAYKEDQVILNTVKNVLQQDYPVHAFDVVVIADQFRQETLRELSLLQVKVIEVAFEKSTKARSIKCALQALPDHCYQCILVLDADNLLGKGCLEKANHAYASGFRVIQLHRTAKNKNTNTAILDAISEEIGNTIARKGHRAMGLSASLIGSGMVFDYPLFKNVMMSLDIEDNPAEDREINAEILKRGFICEYIDDGWVYDEKVQSNTVLERQRERWISAQMNYVKRFWIKNPLQTITTNTHYTDYAIQTLLLPRSILIVVNLIIFLISLLLLHIVRIPWRPGTIYWMFLFFICVLSLGIGVGKNITRRELKRAIFSFPVTFWSFLKALLKSSAGQREFIHTPKEFTEEGKHPSLTGKREKYF